jgi:transposase-like protein
MTHQDECSVIRDLVDLAMEHGPDAMAAAFATLMNHAMQIEREQVLKAESHQRTADRQGYANGFKPKTLNTRVGQVELRIPQTRDYRDANGRPFYPKALGRGVRSERAMILAMAEMYVQGVSTRKVTAIVEELCGLEVTSTQVSRAAAELDEQLDAWRNRPIGEITYLVLDARYEKLRHDGAIRSCALLTAIGIDTDGKRSVLGCSVQLSEAEPHWRKFLESLQKRGMHGVKLIVSDDHAGLRAADHGGLPGGALREGDRHAGGPRGGVHPVHGRRGGDPHAADRPADGRRGGGRHDDDPHRDHGCVRAGTRSIAQARP